EKESAVIHEKGPCRRAAPDEIRKRADSGNRLPGALLSKFKPVIRRNPVGEGAAIVAKLGVLEGLLHVLHSHCSAALRHRGPHVGAEDGGMAGSAGPVAYEICAERARDG